MLLRTATMLAAEPKQYRQPGPATLPEPVRALEQLETSHNIPQVGCIASTVVRQANSNTVRPTAIWLVMDGRESAAHQKLPTTSSTPVSAITFHN